MEILLINTGYYPDKDAGSVRVTGFAKMLKKIGHHPVIVGYREFNDYKIETIDDIDYISLRPRLRNFKKSIKELLSSKIVNPTCIWIYWAPFTTFCFLKKYCKKRKINIIHDSVEWYSTNNLREKLSYHYIEKQIVNKYVIDKQFKVIAISSFLNNYYNDKKIESIRIPILFDVKKINYNKMFRNDRKINIFYAGSPVRGKTKIAKDDLQTIFNALSKLDSVVASKIKFVIMGLNENQINEYYNIDLNNNIEIKALGRVPREQVLKLLESAHFTILLRDANARYAKAGFPTKVVESLATGTPVICNLSSDLGMYLNNGKNSIILDSNSEDALVKTLTVITNYGDDELKLMQKYARELAENCFDYSVYLGVLEKLLS